MTKLFKIRPIPPNFGDRFPDGDYTVGRGAAPRGRAVIEAERATAAAKAGKKVRKTRKKAVRPAAE